jgi:ABC-type glycerol-3-phosphate transport system substrate-binding protein
MSIRNSCARAARPELTCVLACLLAFSLSGCKGAAPTPEPVSITFPCSDISLELYEPLAQEFNEQHPHITVNLRRETEGGLINLEAEGADVRPVWQAMFDPVQERGDILALDPFIEQDASLDLSDFYPAALQVFTVDGEIWAIPFGANPVVMYYNQDLFDQYDVPYPENGWTWDDFLSAALAIRDPEAGVFGYYTNMANYEPLAEQFHELHPHVTVELVTAYSDRGSNPLDVLDNADLDVIRWWDSYLTPERREGLLPLDAMVEVSEGFPLDDMVPGVMEALQIDGVQWGIPAAPFPRPL